ncbi:hypothetical protein [Streptococcus pluranimalium]|uniref:hypothetical protein n=1 Tax=Streptococcus pluranimalium TaxID=82348 RepID=UPI003138C650
MKEIIIPKDLARTFKLRQSSQVTASLISGGHLVLRNVKEKPRNSISTWVLVVLTAALSVGFYSWSTSSQLSQIPMTGTPSIFAALLLTGGPLY